MLVLRIENENGRGAYTGNGPGTQAARTNPYNEIYADYHPNPGVDPLMKAWYGSSCIHDYYFGFVDWKSLLRWFPKKRWSYFVESRNHFCINEYYTEDYIIGKRQVAFLIRDAVMRRTLIDFKDLPVDIARNLTPTYVLERY